jgi:glycosyltransferase involved in cell wall biosynthesis
VRQHDDALVLLFGPSSEDRGDPSLTGIGRARVRRLDPRLTGRALAERLAAEADVVALWRGALETWPASAAARTALASGVPVATAGGGLGELTGAVHTADDLAGAVGALLDDEALALAVADRTRDFCNEHSWTRVGERHVELWNALESS